MKEKKGWIILYDDGTPLVEPTDMWEKRKDAERFADDFKADNKEDKNKYKIVKAILKW